MWRSRDPSKILTRYPGFREEVISDTHTRSGFKNTFETTSSRAMPAYAEASARSEHRSRQSPKGEGGDGVGKGRSVS